VGGLFLWSRGARDQLGWEKNLVSGWATTLVGVYVENSPDSSDGEKCSIRTIQWLDGHAQLAGWVSHYFPYDADLLTTRLAIHDLRAVRSGIEIRATVSCHLLPFAPSTIF
jgi:hypothetical protein